MTRAGEQLVSRVTSFVELEAAHLDQIATIESEVSAEPWSRSLFAGELEMHSAARHWLVALDGPTVVGFGGLMFVEDDAHLMNIAVAPDQQGRGTATRLLHRLMTEAKARGSRGMTLEVRIDNEPARRLYAKFGFAPAGIRKNYYVGGGDALVMWAHGIDTDDYGRRLQALDPHTDETSQR